MGLPYWSSVLSKEKMHSFLQTKGSFEKLLPKPTKNLQRKINNKYMKLQIKTKSLRLIKNSL